MNKNFTLFSLATIALVAAFLAVCIYYVPITKSPFYKEAGSTVDSNSLIAHACGTIDGVTYTNSREALEKSIARGFKFIEIDLVVSSDGHIIALHDWKQFHNRTGHAGDTEPITREEFLSRKIDGKYTPIDAEYIVSFMEKYPDITIVTDKINRFELLLEQIPFPDRLIVEVFHIGRYWKAIGAGIKYPALEINTAGRTAQALWNKIPIVTFRTDHFEEGIERYIDLHDKNITVMMFVVNDKEYQDKYFTAPASMYYMD